MGCEIRLQWARSSMTVPSCKQFKSWKKMHIVLRYVVIHFNSFNMKTAPQEDKLTHDQKRLYNWYINVQIFAQNWWTKREYRAVYGDADAIRIVSTAPLFRIGRNRLSDLSEFSPIWIFAEDVWIILFLGNSWIHVSEFCWIPLDMLTLCNCISWFCVCRYANRWNLFITSWPKLCLVRT